MCVVVVLIVRGRKKPPARDLPRNHTILYDNRRSNYARLLLCCGKDVSCCGPIGCAPGDPYGNNKSPDGVSAEYKCIRIYIYLSQMV